MPVLLIESSFIYNGFLGFALIIMVCKLVFSGLAGEISDMDQLGSKFCQQRRL